jgi:ABC-2 type transport system permease protein
LGLKAARTILKSARKVNWWQRSASLSRGLHGMEGFVRTMAMNNMDDKTIPKPGPTTLAYAERRIGTINWLGVWTLYTKEVQRFLKVVLQTVLAPAVTAILFFAIFTVAFGGSNRTVGDIPFSQFLVPGLIMMAIVQNSFANTSSSLLIAKVQGTIVDVLMPPISAGELTTAIAIGGLTRGILVACSVAIPLIPFVEITIYHPFVMIYFGVSASLLLSLMGMLAGIWADKFDHMAAITNFVIMPLSFLSGTFYSITKLPEVWQTICQFNPFFYMIDGFRYAFIDHADGSILQGMIVLFALNTTLWLVCHRVFKKGYRIKP